MRPLATRSWKGSGEKEVRGGQGPPRSEKAALGAQGTVSGRGEETE